MVDAPIDPGQWLNWLTHKLPAAFIVLALLLVGLGWFVYSENRHREAVYAPLLAACLRMMEQRQ
jgi:hypothetical protein